jgi:hypothetical protein
MLNQLKRFKFRHGFLRISVSIQFKKGSERERKGVTGGAIEHEEMQHVSSRKNNTDGF